MSRPQALLAAFALVAAAFFANLLSSVVGVRADFTADRTFTLAPASRRLVAKLDEPVKLEFFVSRADVKLGAYRKATLAASRRCFASTSRPRAANFA